MSFQLAPSISVLRIMRDGAWAWAVLLGVGVVEGGWGVAGRDGDGDGDGGGGGGGGGDGDGDGDGDGRMVGPCGCRSVGVLEGVEQGEGERGRWACVA